MQNIGTRKAVMNGGATKTSGGLKKKDLMINTRGKIVSKKLHNLAVRRIQHGGELLYELKPIEAVKKYLESFIGKKTLQEVSFTYIEKGEPVSIEFNKLMGNTFASIPMNQITFTKSAERTFLQSQLNKTELDQTCKDFVFVKKGSKNSVMIKKYIVNNLSTT